MPDQKEQNQEQRSMSKPWQFYFEKGKYLVISLQQKVAVSPRPTKNNINNVKEKKKKQIAD